MIDFTDFNSDGQKYIIKQVLNNCTVEIVDGDRIVCESIFMNGCGFDTESTTITHKAPDFVTPRGRVIKGKTTVIDCFCYTFQVAVGTGYYAIFRYMYQFLDFFENLIAAVNEINAENNTNALCIMWVANLAHEWAFVKHRLHERFGIQKLFAKTERDPLYIRCGNVELRECIGLFGHSLADIADNWTETKKLKGDLDYNLIRHAETKLTDFDPYIIGYEYDKNKRLIPKYKYSEKQYSINDVRILTEMHQNVVQTYIQENGAIKLPTTASGFVRLKLKTAIRNNKHLTEWREHYNDTHAKPINDNITLLKRQNRFMIDSEYQWHICRNYSYAGGLAGSNYDYIGKPLKGVVCADITSDYPAQFTHHLYPSGRIHHCGGEEYAEHRDKPYFVVLHIKKMRSKNAHSVYSVHKILNLKGDMYTEYGKPRNIIDYNGKIWQGENIIAIWNDVDLQAYRENYEMEYQIIEMWYFDRYHKIDNWLLESMWDDYEIKSKLKADNKHKDAEYKQIYNDAKRDVNTYYGVCATRLHDLLNALDDDLNFYAEEEQKFSKTRWQFWLNPYYAFWCTSYARALLIHYIAKYPDCIVQYDTDSLYYIKSKGSELEKAMLKYNEILYKKNERIFRKRENKKLFRDLGCWDFDPPYRQFLALGAKKYIKEDEEGIQTVIAGLPKQAIPRKTKEQKLQPFEYYNPLKKFMETNDSRIIIEHMFSNKFASVYCDHPTKNYTKITDYQGKTINQELSSYHAIVPIDFTLSIAYDFLQHLITRQ
ncbi:MAG: hypothetical protein MJZ37_08495 [Bacilli bacterium]|nr:hypothetical protein [Bacilli bacterium]